MRQRIDMDGICSVCGKAVVGSDVLYTADARVVCPTCSPTATLPPPKAPGMSVVVPGAIAGAIPFFISTASSSWSSVNGNVTSFMYRDWIAVGAGAFAIACGAVAIVIAGRAKASKVMGLAALVVALG